MLRPGYAIEYDYVKPHQLSLGLEVRMCPGLFTAGQLNGTSGYEEAAAQGLIAGINAAQRVKGLEPFIIRRSEGYLGVLLDDLVTKGVKEPYRLLTSRAEYRLILRQDNADLRLTKKGREVGLVNDQRWQYYQEKVNKLASLNNLWKSTVLSPQREDLQDILIKINSSPLKTGVKVQELLRRPEVTLNSIRDILPGLKDYSDEVLEEAEIEIKYTGYIQKQQEEIERFSKLEEKILSREIDYSQIRGLSTEGKQRLIEVQPSNIGQASRVTGVSPADISVLLVYLEQGRRRAQGV